MSVDLGPFTGLLKTVVVRRNIMSASTAFHSASLAFSACVLTFSSNSNAHLFCFVMVGVSILHWIVTHWLVYFRNPDALHTEEHRHDMAKLEVESAKVRIDEERIRRINNSNSIDVTFSTSDERAIESKE